MVRVIRVCLPLAILLTAGVAQARPGSPRSAEGALRRMDGARFSKAWKAPGQKRYFYKHAVFKTRLKSGQQATLMMRPGASSGRLVIDVTDPKVRHGSSLKQRYVVQRGVMRRWLHNRKAPAHERAVSYRQAAKILGQPSGLRLWQSAQAELRQVKRSGVFTPKH